MSDRGRHESIAEVGAETRLACVSHRKAADGYAQRFAA